MGNPLQSIPNLPPAISLSGAEQLWINQAGVDRRTTSSALAALASLIQPISGGGVAVANYATIRATQFPPTVTTMVLNDPYKGGFFVRAAAPTRDNGGTVINDAGGQSWLRVYDEKVSAAWFYDAPPTHAPGDGTGVGITAADIAANPQWINLLPPAVGGGAYPVGMTWDNVALQECLYACYAGLASTPGHLVWNTNNVTNNLSMWVQAGHWTMNKGLYLSATGVNIEFAGRNCELFYTGPQNASAITFDAISYGAIYNLRISDSAGIKNLPVVDINWTGANPGLKIQQLTFYDWVVVGGLNYGSVGVYIARHGGDAQGDTITFVNPLIYQVMQGLIAGGANALSIIILGGDFQSCWRDGVVAHGGTVYVYGTSFQASANDYHDYPQIAQIPNDGYDVHCYPGGGGTSRSQVFGMRSENVTMVADLAGCVSVRDSASAFFYGTSTWQANAHWNLGQVVKGGQINTLAMLVDDGGPSWFPADATSTNTRMVNGAAPGWTTNQWAGYVHWFRYANGFSGVGVVASSDANSITDPNGFYGPPGTPTDVLTGYFVKIAGISGATQPAWDTFPPGQSVQPNATGQGFATTAGSNTMTGPASTPLQNGWWVAIPNALLVTQPPTAAYTLQGALIGKVSNLRAGNTFDLVDNQGLPVPASLAFTDQLGFFGPGIPDGQLTWLPIDWDVMSGVASGDNNLVGPGKLRNMGLTNFAYVPVGQFNPSQVRSGAGTAPAPNFSLRNGSAIAEQSMSAFPILASAVTTLNTLQVATQKTLFVNVPGLNPTINMPIFLDGAIMEVRMVLRGTTGSGWVVTWGTNVRAAAPTLTLGTAAQETIVNMLWMGGPGAGQGQWVVTGITGPL